MSVTAVTLGVYFLGRWRLTRAACTQNVARQEVRRLGATGMGRGLKGRKPCFPTCLCHAGCCGVYTLGVCGTRGKTTPVSPVSSAGRLQRCLRKVMFYF